MEKPRSPIIVSAILRALSKSLSGMASGKAFMFLRIRVKRVRPQRNSSWPSLVPMSWGLSSQRGSNANLTTVSYDDTSGDRTVTNALGEQEIYYFTTLEGIMQPETKKRQQR